MSMELTTLSNGLRIVTDRMPGIESATVGVWLTAGARHEAVEQNGIAHFLEHMAFKGTARRSALRIAEEIEDVGGYINAYTSREMTAYYARVLAADVPLALDIIADITLNPAFDPREIEVERGVILQEIGQALDTPDDIIFDWLQEAAFPDQALGRSILGPAARVRGFGREDLRSFVGAHYGPGQMILAAAGAVDHGALVRMAESQFGHLAPCPLAPIVPARFESRERREKKALEQVHFALAFAAPGARDMAAPTAQVYASALGGSMSSRLFQKLREEAGLCYSVFAQASHYEDAGLFTIYAGTGSDEIGELARLTVEELRRAAGGMTEVEIARARAQLRAGVLMGLESPSSRAERMARMLAIWGRVPGVEETVARIDAVGLADARRYGEALLTSPAALALYGPIDGAPPLARLSEALAA